jgi:hypothetical protein
LQNFHPAAILSALNVCQVKQGQVLLQESFNLNTAAGAVVMPKSMLRLMLKVFFATNQVKLAMLIRPTE